MTVVLGAVGTALTIESCDKLTVVAAAGRVRVVNSLDTRLQVFTPTEPLLLGDCRGVSLAPLHTSYPRLRECALLSPPPPPSASAPASHS